MPKKYAVKINGATFKTYKAAAEHYQIDPVTAKKRCVSRDLKWRGWSSQQLAATIFPYGLWQATNLVNGHVFVYVSKNRRKARTDFANSYCQHDNALGHDYRKYGKVNFKLELLIEKESRLDIYVERDHLLSRLQTQGATIYNDLGAMTKVFIHEGELVLGYKGLTDRIGLKRHKLLSLMSYEHISANLQQLTPQIQ